MQCLIQPALTPFLSFLLVQSASNIRRISSSVVDNQLMLFILQRFVPLFPIIAPPPPHTHLMQSASNMRISSSAVYNQLMLFMLLEADSIFRRLLGIDKKAHGATTAEDLIKSNK